MKTIYYVIELEEPFRILEWECHNVKEDEDSISLYSNNGSHFNISKQNNLIFGYGSYQLCYTKKEALIKREQFFDKRIKELEEIVADTQREICILLEFKKESQNKEVKE